MTVQEGALLCGRYRLQQSVGRGGMADVYLAFDSKRQAQVAVKILREDLAEDPDFVRRFRREAEALAQLDHPNIVHFYAFEQDGLVAFIVMDYIAGTTLRRHLQERRGPLEVKELTPILRDVCSALHYAHVNGFVHRDLKPGNVMLKRDGTALLTDFGISRAVEGATLTAAVMGTPAYMSPEQIEGGPVDARSDIYSLGVLLFEMATGRRPFTGDEPGLTQSGTTTRVQQAHLRLPPPDPRSLNPRLPAAASAVILRALAKRPADRWPDVVSLRGAWEAAVGAAGAGFAGAGAAAATPARIPPPAARRPFPGWMLALVAVALLAIAAVLFLVFRAPREREVAAQVTAPALTPVTVQASATAPSSVPPPTAKPAQQRGGVVQLASRAPSATASPASDPVGGHGHGAACSDTGPNFDSVAHDDGHPAACGDTGPNFDSIAHDDGGTDHTLPGGRKSGLRQRSQRLRPHLHGAGKRPGAAGDHRRQRVLLGSGLEQRRHAGGLRVQGGG